MRYFYDTEFIEDGHTIDLVSIGIVAEDGREYYAVSSEFDVVKLQRNPWLAENVWPSLPSRVPRTGLYYELDRDHRDVRSRAQIAREVRDFVLGDPSEPAALRELWADYGAYDHVALCQLFGTMMDLPDGMPMWTHDLRQFVQSSGATGLPEQATGQHNALEDARHLRTQYEYLCGWVVGSA